MPAIARSQRPPPPVSRSPPPVAITTGPRPPGPSRAGSHWLVQGGAPGGRPASPRLGAATPTPPAAAAERDAEAPPPAAVQESPRAPET